MTVDPLLIDLYVGDLVPPGGTIGNPNLAAVIAAGRPWVGIELKATQGLYYPNNKSPNEFYRDTWFKTFWPMIPKLAGERMGVDFFRREYHYGDLAQDPIAQARWNIAVVKSTGSLFGKGDLATTLDIEDAGNPVNPGKAFVERWIKAYADEMLRLTGIRPILYGNNYLHENNVDFKNCGCLALEVARYAASLPSEVYTGIGASLSDLFSWQYIGTEGATPVPHGYPQYTPLSSTHAEDIAAVVMNDALGFEASLKWLREHCIPPEQPNC